MIKLGWLPWEGVGQRQGRYGQDGGPSTCDHIMLLEAMLMDGCHCFTYVYILVRWAALTPTPLNALVTASSSHIDCGHRIRFLGIVVYISFEIINCAYIMRSVFRVANCVHALCPSVTPPTNLVVQKLQQALYSCDYR